MNVILLSVIGGAIILGLGSYAGYLLIKLRKQQRAIALQRSLAMEKRNANIFENVSALCSAGLQGQCDLSELSIRIYCILEYVQGENPIDIDKDYPAIAELYHTVKDMARADDRVALSKSERMNQNLVRMKAEAKLSEKILSEMKLLQANVNGMNSMISIQVSS